MRKRMNHRLKTDRAGRCSTAAVLSWEMWQVSGASTATLHPLPQDTPPDGHPLPSPPSPQSPQSVSPPAQPSSPNMDTKGPAPSSVEEKSPTSGSTAADGQLYTAQCLPSSKEPQPWLCAGARLLFTPTGSAQQWPQPGRAWREKRGVFWARGKTQAQHMDTSSLAAHILERRSKCPLVLIPSCTS